MKRRECLLIGIGILALFVIISLGTPGIVNAQKAQKEQCAVVTIGSDEGISPEVLKIKKGGCVVWLNMTLGEDVRVTFKEGKKCADMTKSPKGFHADWSGCYVTDFLDFGKTSSLQFVEAGTFRYEVSGFRGAAGQGQVPKFGRASFGTIIVE